MSSSTKAQAQHLQQQQQRDNQRRMYASSPPSPIRLNRALSAFYSAPSFEDVKKKSLTLLPSPTTMQTMNLDIKDLPDEPTSSRNSLSSNPGSPFAGQPTVALTEPSPVLPRPRRGDRFYNVDDEGDAIMGQERNPRPFMVNASDIPAKQSSPANDLSEVQQRGMDRIKRLSNDALSISREGSPVPRGRLSEDMSSKDGASDKRRIEELQIRNNQLRDNLLQKLNTEDEVSQLKMALNNSHMQTAELKQKLESQQRDYELMSKNYLDHVRMIRATDDDHSTIMERLSQLKNAIEHLIKKAQGHRSVNLNRPAVIKYLNDSGRLAGFPISEDKLESYQLNLFMESMIMSTLVSFFFEKSLSCVFDYNNGFKDIYNWMNSRNPTLAVRWRQQLCVMLTQDPETEGRQKEEVKTAVSAISDIISKVYTNTDESVKISDICNKAFSLSVAMTGLESAIAPETVPIGTPFDEETMNPAHKSNPTGNVVLVVFPAFKDGLNAFSIPPKVWCY